MRILITGGCGFLGHHIVEHLLKHTDAKIVVLDKLSYSSNGFERLRDIEVFDNQRVEILGCDLSRSIPQGVSQEIGPLDFVVHTAAETHVDNSIADPLPFLQSNVLGTHHLLWWLKERQNAPERLHVSGGDSRKLPRRIFLVSTDEVYGPAAFGDDVAGFDETAPFRPANPYAAAKAGGECVGMAYANTYKLPVTIVNTMNLIGERQHPEKFIPMVIRSVLENRTVPIHADAGLTRSGSRFYIHCRTFADALTYLIERETFEGHRDWPTPLKLHVCGEREITNLELAAGIAAVIGKPLRYELVNFHSSRPGHDLRYAMSDRLITELGWQRPMMLEQSLPKMVRWYLDHPSWLGLKPEAGHALSHPTEGL